MNRKYRTGNGREIRHIPHLVRELSRTSLRPIIGRRILRDDQQLIEATLDGESAAFGELVLKYQDRLYNTLLHVVGSAEDALDVVQDAFVQSFVKLDTFRGRSAFYTWLYRIAFNQAMSHKRRRRPTLSVEAAMHCIGGEPVDPQIGAAGPLLQQERVDQIRLALEKLSTEHRAILVLREIDGCCYETIAEVLELPVGTVRSRLHRARMHLREQLKHVFQEEAT